LLSIPKEYPYFFRISPQPSNLMGYETRLNRVKDSTVPCDNICNAGDFEPDLVLGGENRM